MAYVRKTEILERDDPRVTIDDFDHNAAESFNREEQALTNATNAVAQTVTVDDIAARLALNILPGRKVKQIEGKALFELQQLPANDADNWAFLGYYGADELSANVIDDEVESSPIKTRSIDSINASLALKIDVESIVNILTSADTDAPLSAAQGKALKDLHDALVLTVAGKQATSEKNVANGYAGLDSGGKLDASQLPPLAITKVHVVANQAARLALSPVEEGDAAKQTDNGRTYLLGSGASNLDASWTVIGDTDILISDVVSLQAALDAKLGATAPAVAAAKVAFSANNSFIGTDVINSYPDGYSVFYSTSPTAQFNALVNCIVETWKIGPSAWQIIKGLTSSGTNVTYWRSGLSNTWGAWLQIADRTWVSGLLAAKQDTLSAPFFYKGSIAKTNQDTSIPDTADFTGLSGNGVWLVTYTGAGAALIQFVSGSSTGILQIYRSYDGNLLHRNITDSTYPQPWRTLWDSTNFNPANKQNVSEKNNANGYAGLDSGGKINASQLPPLAVSKVTVVANQAARLALTAEEGDVAKQTDNGRTYWLSSGASNLDASWVVVGDTDIIIGDVAGLQAELDAKAEIDDAETTSTTKTWSVDKIKSYTAANGGLNIVPCILMIGESNSGGVALNSDASGGEIGTQPQVQIMNPVSLVFEDLVIGGGSQNNLLDHTGLTPTYGGVCHGMELGLAIQAGADQWPTEVVYLIKAGQGGSRVDEWDDTEGTYFQKFVDRIEAAKAHFAANGQTPLFYIWYSHGINDAIAETDIGAFTASMKAFWANIRQYTGFAPIAMTEIPVAYEEYNDAMRELIAEDKFATMVDTTGLTLMGDGNHWPYASMKEIATRMRAATLVGVGYSLQYMLSQNYALSTRPVGTIGGGETPVTELTWGLMQNCAPDGGTNALEYTTGSPAGAESEEIVDATTNFEYIIKYNDAQGLSGIVVLLEDSSSGPNTWSSSSDPFVSGVYCSLGSIHRSVQRNSSTVVTTTTEDDIWIRVRKSGTNSVQYDMSEDAGTTWTNNIFTDTGVLSGETTLYLKVIFAVTGDGAKSVIVDRIA